jgi:tetratricopeptide (TPR) repeat protein
MAEADATAANGDADLTVAAYRKVAADNPSRAEPWVKIGQLRFSRAEYSLAIVAAEEALKRDPVNRQAKSIQAVGGLRMGIKSLEELRKEGELSGDAATDARRLAAVLREALGQQNLIAEPAPPPPPPPARRRAPAPRPAADAGAGGAAPAAAPAPARKPSGGNPLDAFK